MILTDGAHFKDEYGRTLLLRGVNLGGSSKVPAAPDGATYRADGFYNHREVSFVGRPFPLRRSRRALLPPESLGLHFSAPAGDLGSDRARRARAVR